jgi:hypothetical protein
VKSARNTLPHALPEVAANDVTGGLDWARDDHAVSVVNNRSREIDRCTVEHSTAGLRDLTALLGVTASARSRSNAPTARSSTPSCRPGSAWS